jgi:L-fuconate dehydratase
MERNVLEYVDHLHEHFVSPCSINDKGRYNVPNDPNEGYRYVLITWIFHEHCLMRDPCSIEMHKSSIAEYEWPNGTYWEKRREEGSI